MPTQSAISEAAAALGRKGGRSRSAAKVAAVRANGRKGGRPKGAKKQGEGRDLDAVKERARIYSVVMN